MNDIHKIFEVEKDIDNDVLFKKAYKKALDAQFKQKLKDAYENQKIEIPPAKRGKVISIRTILAVAACMVALLAAIFLFNPLSNSAFDNTLAYEIANPVEHPGLTKGVSEAHELKESAIKAYNNGNYAEAISFYNQMSSQDDQDKYFIALSYFYSKDYKNAVDQFNSLNSASYSQEKAWFLSLALVKLDNKAEAKAILQSIESNHWNYKKAKEILKNLE